MPGMTGVELLAQSTKLQPQAMRILLTGYTDIESVIAAINSGQIYRYVTKPWDPVDLGNAVDKAIERFDLSAELVAKNVALESALSELRVLDEAKSSFMILINHELKTPLTSMISFLDLLRETQLDAEQKKYIARVDQSAERLRALIEDSLELVSAEAGTLPIKNAKVNLQKIIDELSARYETALEQKQMSLRLTLDAEDVRTDLKAATSILTRLFDNAVKFGSEKTTVTLTAQPTLNGVEVTLVNSGKTIKAESLAKILKPFSLDENVMHHSKGTGLGLSVAQALLKRLGSRLEVVSNKG